MYYTVIRTNRIILVLFFVCLFFRRFSVDKNHIAISTYFTFLVFFLLFFFPLSLSESSRSPAAISSRIAEEAKRPER